MKIINRVVLSGFDYTEHENPDHQVGVVNGILTERGDCGRWDGGVVGILTERGLW